MKKNQIFGLWVLLAAFFGSTSFAYPTACVKTSGGGCKITDSDDGDIRGTVNGDYCDTAHGDHVRIQSRMAAPPKPGLVPSKPKGSI